VFATEKGGGKVGGKKGKKKEKGKGMQGQIP
jgi:hypothetical protein